MTIRPTQASDVPDLQAVLDATELFPSEMLPDMIATFLNDASGAERWLTALQGETPVGFCYATAEPMAQDAWNMLAIAVAFAWIGFRLVSYSVFADFLIAVEAEMNKVSWPGRAELWRASVVVMFVIFAMAAFLFVFDLVWTAIFELIGIRYSGGGFVDTLLKTIGLR